MTIILVSTLGFQLAYADTSLETLKGVVVKENFVDRKGRKSSTMFTYWLQGTAVRYFIKLSESSVTKNKLDSILGRKVRIRGKIAVGLWDADNPAVQSRIGEYLAITEILPE